MYVNGRSKRASNVWRQHGSDRCGEGVRGNNDKRGSQGFQISLSSILMVIYFFCGKRGDLPSIRQNDCLSGKSPL